MKTIRFQIHINVARNIDHELGAAPSLRYRFGCAVEKAAERRRKHVRLNLHPEEMLALSDALEHATEKTNEQPLLHQLHEAYCRTLSPAVEASDIIAAGVYDNLTSNELFDILKS